MKKMNKITFQMIEGIINDMLDNAYDPFIFNDLEIPASEIIKKIKPNIYDDMVAEYIINNHIKQVVNDNGVTEYFEPSED